MTIFGQFGSLVIISTRGALFTFFKYLPYTVIFIFDGHMASGVSYDRQPTDGDWYRTIGGKDYFYCETTAIGYDIGHAPSGLVFRYAYVVK